MVRERREQGRAEQQRRGMTDLLGALVQASSTEEGKDRVKEKEARLTDQEVMSNIYVILLAGHGKPCKLNLLSEFLIVKRLRYYCSYTRVHFRSAGTLSKNPGGAFPICQIRAAGSFQRAHL